MAKNLCIVQIMEKFETKIRQICNAIIVYKVVGYILVSNELFAPACKTAKEIGAKKLYISAHSSKESQAAYRKLGCIEATEINQVIAENEPYDIPLLSQ